MDWLTVPYLRLNLIPYRNRGSVPPGATLWDNLIDCLFHHFQYDVKTGENYFPRNVYPKTYEVKLRDGEVWVNLE